MQNKDLECYLEIVLSILQEEGTELPVKEINARIIAMACSCDISAEQYSDIQDETIRLAYAVFKHGSK